MAESGLRFYSLGIVVEDKPEGVDYILVSPVETLNIQAPGSIKEYSKSFKGNQKELESTDFKTEHESKNYERAKWLPLGHSNRISAPDVVANETVILFKFANVNDVYWTTLFREPALRRLEDVLYAFSNLPKGMGAFDKNSSYWARFSTKGQFVHLHTSSNNKEHTTYDIKIDTKAGTLEVKDGKKNNILLDSPSNTLTINTQNAVNVNTTKEVNVVTKVVNIIADTSTTIKSKIIKFIGDVFIEGNTKMSGNLNTDGNVGTKGKIDAKGDINSAGKIMDAGGNSNHHSH